MNVVEAGGDHGGWFQPKALYYRAFFALGDGEAFYNPCPLPERPFPFSQFLSRLVGILDSGFVQIVDL